MVASPLAGDAAVVERVAQTARVFIPSIVVGELFYGAYRSGRTEANKDLWIAALARQHGLTLVTRDAHFTGIESLSIEQW